MSNETEQLLLDVLEAVCKVNTSCSDRAFEDIQNILNDGRVTAFILKMHEKQLLLEKESEQINVGTFQV